MSDLWDRMKKAGENAARFVDAYWSSLQRAEKAGATCPPLEIVNRLLLMHDSPFEIQPPDLVKRSIDAVVDAPEESSTAASVGSDRYELLEVLGQGAFGTVHRAIRKTSVATFEFALKFLDPSPFVTDVAVATKRFQREVAALVSLQHRGLVQCLDAGIDSKGRHFIVMPFIRGKNIRDASEGLPHSERCLMIAEVLHAVQYAHAKDVLHRDLKPSNILVREVDGQPIVVDFGAAYLFSEKGAGTLTSSAVGSQGYIPSEVIADPRKRSPLHDIYACGVVAYELFARRLPDPRSYQSLSVVHPELSCLDSVIQKAIDSEPARFQTVGEFRDAFVTSARALGMSG